MFPNAKISTVKGTNYGPRHTDHPTKLVFHTTETTGVPGYNGGAFAPHYTFDPKTLVWWYHGVPETHRVGTLVGSTTAGVKTNELSIQVEIICYSSKSVADGAPTRLYVGDLSEAAKNELAKFVDYCRANFALGSEHTPTPEGGWKYGTGATTRLSKTNWLKLAGFTAHGAVPGNSHYDTGILDLTDIEERTEDELTPEEQAALTWLVKSLESKASDKPPWGTINWNKYKAKWSSPPGPLDPVQHIQLSFVLEDMVADMIDAKIKTHTDNPDAHHE